MFVFPLVDLLERGEAVLNRIGRPAAGAGEALAQGSIGRSRYEPELALHALTNGVIAFGVIAWIDFSERDMEPAVHVEVLELIDKLVTGRPENRHARHPPLSSSASPGVGVGN